MDSYRIQWSSAAGRELRRIARAVLPRVVEAVDGLELDPRPRGVTKLEDEDNVWRIRVGPYRVIYEVLDEERLVTVLHIRHRREAYRRL